MKSGLPLAYFVGVGKGVYFSHYPVWGYVLRARRNRRYRAASGAPSSEPWATQLGQCVRVGDHVTVRTMSRDEFGAMRELSITAFGADHAPDIGQLLDALHASWAWDDELCFVAEDDGELVGHVLYTHAILDAPRRLQDVLVLSPIGVRPDRQQHGIGSELMNTSLTVLRQRVNRSCSSKATPTTTDASASLKRAISDSLRRRFASQPPGSCSRFCRPMSRG